MIDGSVPGLTSIAGGKYTTYRVMAADLIDAAARALGAERASVTARVPLLGAERLRELWSARARAGRELGPGGARRSSGCCAATVTARRAAGPRRGRRRSCAEPLDGGLGHIGAEVVYACTHEGALTLADVLERRTRLAIMAPDRGLPPPSRRPR